MNCSAESRCTTRIFFNGHDLVLREDNCLYRYQFLIIRNRMAVVVSKISSRLCVSSMVTTRRL